MQFFHIADLVALSLFAFFWLGFEYIIDHSPLRHKSLSGLMAHKRREWMLAFSDRDLRMFDEGILSGLQTGTSFMGTVSIFAIGGCFALLNSTDIVLAIFKDLHVVDTDVRAAWEIKIIGLTFIFVYSFFKFAWSYRLFNYCGILMGAVPMVGEALPEEIRQQALLAAKMNTVASRHFTAGIRGIFFGFAFLGWLIGPYILMLSTLCVAIVIIRRQFFSNARRILMSAR